MNSKMIVLGIIMVVILYLLYRYLLVKKTISVTNLRYDKTLDPFTYSSLSIPNSTRYCYYIWIYVNMIDTKSENIFKVTDQDKTGNPITLFSLDIINTTDLQTSVLTQNNSITNTTSNIISSNFPIQSWQQVIVSFDNIYMDVYINGKYVKSVHFDNKNLATQTSSNSVINYGVPSSHGMKPPDITIRQFERLDYPMDPQTAWNKYRTDSNINVNNAVDYGLNLNISTNNKVGRSIPIF